MKFKVVCYSASNVGTPAEAVETVPVCTHYCNDLDTAEHKKLLWEEDYPEGYICVAVIYESKNNGETWEQV